MATTRDAGVRERVESAAVTSGVTIALFLGATLVVGMAIFLVGLLMGHGGLGGLLGGEVNGPGVFGANNAEGWRTAAAADDRPWVVPVSLGATLLITWLGSCRFGRGTPGDAFMGLTALTVDGEPAPRWRTMLRTGGPLLVLGAGVAAHSVWSGIAVVAALWLPALVRRDHRTTFDLVAGLRVATNAPVKGDYEWRVGERRGPSA
jgi:hypothetical protein